MKRPRPWESVEGVYYPAAPAKTDADRAGLRDRWAGVAGVSFPQNSPPLLTADEMRAQGWCSLAEAAAILGVSTKTARRFLMRQKALHCAVKARRFPATMWQRSEVLRLKRVIGCRVEGGRLLYMTLRVAAKMTGVSRARIKREAAVGRIRVRTGRQEGNIPCTFYCVDDIGICGICLP